jgi:hypothetical protein
MMFRLTAILCAAIFGVLLLGGRDEGQVRFGLIPRPAPVPRAARLPPADEEAVPSSGPSYAAAPADEMPAAAAARFAPAAPVMTTPAVEVVTAPGTAAGPGPSPAEAPVLALARVTSRSANLREGPGTDYAVVGRLAKGEEVQIVARDEGPDGWVLVRLEGDGGEGYVAARLLAE